MLGRALLKQMAGARAWAECVGREKGRDGPAGLAHWAREGKGPVGGESGLGPVAEFWAGLV